MADLMNWGSKLILAKLQLQPGEDEYLQKTENDGIGLGYLVNGDDSLWEPITFLSYQQFSSFVQ